MAQPGRATHCRISAPSHSVTHSKAEQYGVEAEEAGEEEDDEGGEESGEDAVEGVGEEEEDDEEMDEEGGESAGGSSGDEAESSSEEEGDGEDGETGPEDQRVTVGGPSVREALADLGTEINAKGRATWRRLRHSWAMYLAGSRPRARSAWSTCASSGNPAIREARLALWPTRSPRAG